MDSLTQITLGAAVGEAALGRQLGNRAILWGAVFGTLPDLDMVVAPFQDSIQFLVHHRGLSHSLLAVLVASCVFTPVFVNWYRDVPGAPSGRRWAAFFVLVFLTHILLDCCTNYGTQIFAPFSDRRVAWNTIFIIDPLYTVPFLACVVLCLFLQRTSRWRRRVNWLGISLSTGYLLLTLANKFYVDTVFAESLAQQQISAQRFMTCPTPLNSILWYCVAEVDDGYHIGFYSLLDETRAVAFQYVPRRAELLDERGQLAKTVPVERLIWFADGYYCVRPHPGAPEQGVILYVMKFGKLNLLGEEDLYPFAYAVHRTANPGVLVERYETRSGQPTGTLLKQLWQRLQGTGMRGVSEKQNALAE